MTQEKERKYASLMVKAYEWLTEFQKEQEAFTFKFKNKGKGTKHLFCGRGIKEAPRDNRFYVNLRPDHSNPNHWFTLSFYADAEFTRIFKVALRVLYRDENGGINRPRYKEFLQNELNSDKCNIPIAGPSPEEEEVKNSLLSWLGKHYEALCEALKDDEPLSRDDFEQEKSECIKALCENGVLLQEKDGRLSVPHDAQFAPQGEADEDDAGEDVNNENDMDDDDKIVKLVENAYNVVLTGAPGTGKTYRAKKVALELLGGAYEKWEDALKEGRVGFCQFHPSYDYSDFVEGLRPVEGKDGQVGFKRMDGVFKAFCKKAAGDEERNYVFIIDEINRGDISKIFGELFFSIDPSYRGKAGLVKTQYQNLVTKTEKVKGEDGMERDVDDVFYDGFYVPENVYVIGTMNDIDRNVESMDFAIRRRFTWYEVKPDSKVLDSAENGKPMISEESDRVEARKRMDNLNGAIEKENLLGAAYAIGPAYFLKVDQVGGLDKLWELNLEPLLREYLRGNPKSVVDEKIKEFEAAYGYVKPQQSTIETGLDGSTDKQQ